MDWRGDDGRRLPSESVMISAAGRKACHRRSSENFGQSCFCGELATSVRRPVQWLRFFIPIIGLMSSAPENPPVHPDDLLLFSLISAEFDRELPPSEFAELRKLEQRSPDRANALRKQWPSFGKSCSNCRSFPLKFRGTRRPHGRGHFNQRPPRLGQKSAKEFLSRFRAGPPIVA